MHVSIQHFSQNSKVSGKQGFTVHEHRLSKKEQNGRQATSMNLQQTTFQKKILFIGAKITCYVKSQSSANN